ncbi:putative hotdog family 3-hydroxylacyl-ACP dehydratase [Erwinia toletana]|uniref:Hotdog family 3-hydroxylacyl-ACP dehydratase n=1 Tax=Winslowiella toletana TaxID=92490 RepID=A0ABS4PE36_9GAMM|nr:hotdog family protein [Winslowiella toletana]MBP2170895.1 putative hotdog family 3-hydroxylacyl-ACP dehydratase [Winslowiella toletana]
MAELLSAEHYLPHATPMVLLEHVLQVDDESADCQVHITADSVLAPFLTAEGALPAWFGVEIIAQTIGVWSGWHARQRNDRKPRPGMLLGGRGYRCSAPQFPAGAQLDVRVTLLMHDDKIASFDGEITINGELYASGRLNTYQPDEEEFNKMMQQDSN